MLRENHIDAKFLHKVNKIKWRRNRNKNHLMYPQPYNYCNKNDLRYLHENKSGIEADFRFCFGFLPGKKVEHKFYPGFRVQR